LGGSFSIHGTLILGGPSNFPTGWTTLTIDPNSTVKYNYNGNKLIYPATYGNLVIEGNGTYQANRFISSVTVTNGGSGYTMFDEFMGILTFSGGGGSGASASFRRASGPDPFAVSSINSVRITNSGSGYTSTPTVTLIGTTGSGATFVANLTSGSYSAITTTIINILPPSLDVSLPIASLTACSGASSEPTTFRVSGSDLTASITISAPSDFEISTDPGGTYSPSLTLTNTTIVSKTIYVRLSAAASVGTISGSITATSSSITATTTVSGTVYAIPTISILKADLSGITINDGIICNGASATLTASGGSTYLWSTGESTASITKSPTNTTIYTVSGTTSAGCSNITSVTVTVNPIPTISISESDASGTSNNDSKVCIGGIATLTAIGGSTYSWSTLENASLINPSISSNTTYTVTGTTAGCSNTASITITVESLPSLSYNSISLSNESTYLITKTTSVSSNDSWTVSGTISVNNGYITAGTTPGTYTVSYTDGCAQTVTATVTVSSTSNLPAITDGQASYKFNNNPQGPIGSGNVVYMGYNGFNYSSTTRPTKPGFYRANNVSGNSAGCPFPFEIFRCTTCPD
jgi:hypothetical protein